MEPLIIAVSGPISSGKSDLVSSLAARYGCDVVKTSKILLKHARRETPDRQYMQRLGDRLDRETDGAWIRDAVRRQLGPDLYNANTPVIVDSVRIQKQVDYLRSGYGHRRVLHIHVTAPDDILRERYRSRGRPGELSDYEDVRRNRTEKKIENLAHDADVVVDSGRCTREDVFIRAACLAGLMQVPVDRTVDVLVGGQYGSEGKGQIAAFLMPEYDVVVRVGGPNAGHKVYAEPAARVFHHLPSGSHEFTGQIVLGPGAVLNVNNLLEEIAEHDIGTEQIAIDPQAMVIADEDIASESGLVSSIASTGQGVGIATARKVLRNAEHKRGDGSSTAVLPPPVTLAGEMDVLSPYIRPTRDVLSLAYARGARILLEGTQGTHLSIHHGLYPTTTSRDTTVSGCLADAGIPPSRVRRIVMVVRSYPIRVGGNSGDMQKEIDFATVAERSGLPEDGIRSTEITTTTGRPRRVGEFEWTKLRESALLNGPTDVALTFVDYLCAKNLRARRFDQLTPDTLFFIEEVERITGANVSLISTRFHERAIIDRRNWKHAG